MTGCLLSTSHSALSVCSGSPRENGDRKAAEAGVAYWRLPRKKTQKMESEMGVRFPWAWLLAERSTKLAPLTGPRRERYGEGTEGGILGPSGRPALSIKLAVGGIFFASSHFAICRRLMVEVM